MEYNKIFEKEPYDFLFYMEEEFNVDIPKEVTTIEDMVNAQKLMLKLSAKYSYLNTLLSYAKIRTRELQRAKLKQEYEDMVDRKETVENFMKAVKQNYQAISRAVTIKIGNNEELKMLPA